MIGMRLDTGGPLTLTLETPTAHAIARAFGEAPELARRHLAKAMWQATLLLQRETVERTPRTTSTLAKSILAQPVEASEDQVVGRVTSPLPYVVPVEIGTKPFVPPVLPLIQWAMAKFGMRGGKKGWQGFPARAVSIGFAVRRKIARVGLSGAHMFRDAFDDSRGQIERMFEKAVDDVYADLHKGLRK